jgi:dGTPase
VVSVSGDPDGFEGNAQSFRIVTRLEMGKRKTLGLNLTRATLHAVLKYPNLRNYEDIDDKKHKKFGAFAVDGNSFQFARDPFTTTDPNTRPSLEATIMDHADEVAYSIQDISDFFCAGLLPLRIMAADKAEFNHFFRENEPYIIPTGINIDKMEIDPGESLQNMLNMFVGPRTYLDTQEDRGQIKMRISKFIAESVEGCGVKDDGGSWRLDINPARQIEINFLKQILKKYVIRNSKLVTQQAGQRHIIRSLYEFYRSALEENNWRREVIPGFYVKEAERVTEKPSSVSETDQQERERAKIRLAVDIVAGLTETQAIDMFGRISGFALGAVSDLISL